MTATLANLLSADFFIMALISGLALAAIAGPLGSFIVWRRMSYFGDTLAHAALLGIAIGLITGSDPRLSIVLSSVLLAILLALMDKTPSLSTDTLLGILAHSALAIGVVVLALSGSQRVNLEAYLFGEILTVGLDDVIWVVSVVAVVAALLWRFWNSLLSVVVDAELAQIEGLPVDRLNMLLMVLLALTVAISMKIVGVLLITALLIIPPATARRLANTPESMAWQASLIGCVAVIAGLLVAFYFDTPVGPTIVMMTTLLFLLALIMPAVSEAP